MTEGFRLCDYAWLTDSTHFAEFLDLAFANDPGEVWLFNNDLEIIRQRTAFRDLYLHRIGGTLRNNVAAVKVLVDPGILPRGGSVDDLLKGDATIRERLAELATTVSDGVERLSTFYFGTATSDDLPEEVRGATPRDRWVFYARRGELDSGVGMLRHAYFPFHVGPTSEWFAVVWLLGQHQRLVQRLKEPFYRCFRRNDRFKRVKVTSLVPFEFELEAITDAEPRSFRSDLSLSVGDRPDVAIIAALPEEFTELLRALQEEGIQVRVVPQAEQYKYAVVTARGGPKVLVMTTVGISGSVPAAVQTWDLVQTWRPTCAVLVGVAGADPHEERIKLGDVVVGRTVIAYEYEKVVPGGTERAPRSWEGDRRLFEIATTDNELKSWRPRCEGTEMPSGADRDRVAIHWDLAVGSGNRVIADQAFFQRIQQKVNRTIKAVEMEGEGVAYACRRAGLNVLVIKGIMDKSDKETRKVLPSEEREKWKCYAARVAAEFAIAVVKRL